MILYREHINQINHILTSLNIESVVSTRSIDNKNHEN